MIRWKGFIIHHSLTEDSGTVSWNAIRRYHTQERHWAAVGYHFGVEKVGDSYEALFGRPLTWHGGHTIGANNTHLGVCFVGNYDQVAPPDEMLRFAAVHILAPIAASLQMVFAPGEHGHLLQPHSKYADKTCPGLLFPMDRLRMLFNDILTETLS